MNFTLLLIICLVVFVIFYMRRKRVETKIENASKERTKSADRKYLARTLRGLQPGSLNCGILERIHIHVLRRDEKSEAIRCKRPTGTKIVKFACYQIL